jgi:hypothetical protein
MDIGEIDAFLAEPKTLLGKLPEWKPNEFRPGEYENTWAVADSLGIVRSALRFRFSPALRAYPSVSLVHRNHLIWRIDLVPPDECKFNPPTAAGLGLPPQVCGPHWHSWSDNRAYVSDHGFGAMPFRRPIAPQIRRIEQAVHMLAGEIALEILPEQRGFDVPPQKTLFEC